MQDEEIRIACINAVVAWTGSSNKMQDAQTFYDWIVGGRRVAVPQDLVEMPVLPKKKAK